MTILDLSIWALSVAIAFWLIFNRPILDFWLNLGFLQISTEIMNDSDMHRERRYVSLRITFFTKWGFQFRLYNLHRNR